VPPLRRGLGVRSSTILAFAAAMGVDLNDLTLPDHLRDVARYTTPHDAARLEAARAKQARKAAARLALKPRRVVREYTFEGVRISLAGFDV